MTPPAPPADPADPTRVLAPGTAPPVYPTPAGRLGRYRLVGLLGRGGMGAVYEAEDPTLGRRVALKVMLPEVGAADPRARERFLREARAQAAVEHDHVVPIYEVGEEAGTPYLTMPLLRGITLATALAANPRPPLRAALRIGRQIAEGLAAAHVAGLVHRDIKPGNVWLEDPRMRVKVLDFGLARLANDEGGRVKDEARSERTGSASPFILHPSPLTQAGTVVGTPYYMSPEQARGDPLDPRSDLFSLGIVLYEMATGRPPFPGNSTQEVLRELAAAHPPAPAALVPDLPPAFSALVMRLLAKDPPARPPSAAAVAAELRAVETALADTDAAPPLAAPAAPSPWEEIATTVVEPAAAPPTRRRRVSVAWVATGAAVVGVAAALLAALPSALAGRGELLVEADPALEVVVKRGGEVVRDRTRDRRFLLPPGEYAVEPADPAPGLKVSPAKVVVDRNGRGEVFVWAEKPKPPAPPPARAAEREAAALLLPRASEMILRLGSGRDLFYGKNSTLPAEPFTVLAFTLADDLGADAVETVLLPAAAKLGGPGGIHGNYPIAPPLLRRLAGTPAGASVQAVTLALDPSPETVAELARFPQLIQVRFVARGPAAGRLAALAGLPPTVNDVWLDALPAGADLPADARAALAGLPVAGLSVREGARFDAALADAAVGMPRLKALTVRNTPTDPAAVAALAGAKRLDALVLHAAGVTDDQLPGFAAFPALVLLDVRGNPVTVAAATRLAAAAPRLRILWDGGALEPRGR